MKGTRLNPTEAQREVITLRNADMLVSASAGTGKTTTMIERIAEIVCDDVDISELVVVTFTNLAAAEMKAKLADKLSEMQSRRAAEQLEKLDTASICTLHSFCVELLRNYFYVVDLDPSFGVLDNVTVAALRKNALNDLFAEYFSKDDSVFKEVYKIFSTHRREDNFRETLLRLYDFACCLENFGDWYASKRPNFVTLDENNAIAEALCRDIRQMLEYQASNWERLYERAKDAELNYAETIGANAAVLRKLLQKDLQGMLDGLYVLELSPLPSKKRNASVPEFEENVRNHCRQLKKELDERIKKYSELYRGERLEKLWKEMELSTVHTDKLAELVQRFDELFFEEKRQRGGVDFNDLEHLTLKLLNDESALADIRARYKMIFVDEYQDTNPVQEAIIRKLATKDNLFMVGDVKQSIYGFRGCDPDIFVNKRENYLSTNQGKVITLNDNFRSNVQILDFVNVVFDGLMTKEFGQVDYKNTAMLCGKVQPKLQTPSVRVDFLKKIPVEKKTLSAVYDITARGQEDDGVKQGELIANRINEYVGKAYTDDNGKTRRIGYGDVVILMRGMTSRAMDIYNTLISRNIPVAASFKVESYANKEVRDLINLFRVIDNPYNDVYLVGVCLVFGELSEQELVPVRLDTEGRIPFYERLLSYAEKGEDRAIAGKIKNFLGFLNELRFYSQSASVCETALAVLQKKNYAMRVQAFPDGAMRLDKLYKFIDGLKGAAYAQSIDKFLYYIDETDEKEADVQNVSNAVRMMTMHASKGLEFPVVIVAGLETKFQFDRFALKTNSALGIAVDYYDFDSMLKFETVGSFVCDAVNAYKQREEEMRLLYVAMTRAKFALDLVATVEEQQLTQLPKQPARAGSHLDWLLCALHDETDLEQKGVEISVFDSVKQEDGERQDSLCEQNVGVDEVLQKISFRYPHEEATSMPFKVVSSALDKEYIDVTEEPLPEQTLLADGNRNEVGTAYHKVYQYVDFNADVNEIRKCIASLTADGRIAEQIAQRLDVQLIYNTLRNPEFQRLLQTGKAYHEIPFMLYAYYDELFTDGESRPHEKVMLQGVIDLLVISKERATVVDFKYTSRTQSVVSRYKAQLNSYRMAVERICGVKDVRCFVLSVADNKLIEF